MEWKCNVCGKDLIETSITAEYMGLKRATPVIQCPVCRTAFVEDYMAKQLVAAEGLFEKKRA
jgi:DNA-directed RNA polymerase subunit RPC12/RpoP